MLKGYWWENERYAYFLNAALFGERPIIRPEDLEELDTDSSTIAENNGRAQSLGGARDSFKIRKKSSAHGIEFVMLGKEFQTYIHYGMPLRIMGYDYITYKKQYDCNAAKYRTKDRKEQYDALETLNKAEQVDSFVKLDHNEFLSKMRRTDKFIPVVTAVVYYGEEPWDGAKSLHEMLQIPKEFEEYVNDYKILLVEARNTDLIFHNTDNIDFFNLMAIILDKNLSGKEIMERAIQYGEEHQADKAVLMAIAGQRKRTWITVHLRKEIMECVHFSKKLPKRESGEEDVRESGEEDVRESGEGDVKERLKEGPGKLLKQDLNLQCPKRIS